MMPYENEERITLKADGWLLRQVKETAQSVNEWPASHRRNVDFGKYLGSDQRESQDTTAQNALRDKCA
jgi:uncharacterized membrane protein